MRHTTPVSACLLGAALTFTGSAGAQNAEVLKDLQSVIALQSKPCGTVTEAVRQGDNDYIATCSNGARYRVQVDASGRVSITAV